MRDRQWEAGQPGPRPEIGPALTWSWPTDCRQPEGVIEVAFPEALQLFRAQEPEPDRFGVGPLKEYPLVGG